jgi:ferredoxin-NADP reductase
VASPWHATALAAKHAETPTAATLELATEAWWPGHRAGQHVDVRLTAEDGYQAQRSYSIASPPEQRTLGITVERFEEGEVSPYLVDEMQPGDELEVRGPIGGWFVWDVDEGGPLLLVAGGSGLVPLMAILRHRAAASEGDVPARLVLSARTLDAVYYAEELRALDERDERLGVTITLTRGAPPGWTGYDRRVDRDMLAEVGTPPAERPRVYICGPTAFVESAAADLVALGHEPGLVKTERFGPSGGSI